MKLRVGVMKKAPKGVFADHIYREYLPEGTLVLILRDHGCSYFAVARNKREANPRNDAYWIVRAECVEVLGEL